MSNKDKEKILDLDKKAEDKQIKKEKTKELMQGIGIVHSENMVENGLYIDGELAYSETILYAHIALEYLGYTYVSLDEDDVEIEGDSLPKKIEVDRLHLRGKKSLVHLYTDFEEGLYDYKGNLLAIGGGGVPLEDALVSLGIEYNHFDTDLDPLPKNLKVIIEKTLENS